MELLVQIIECVSKHKLYSIYKSDNEVRDDSSSLNQS